MTAGPENHLPYVHRQRGISAIVFTLNEDVHISRCLTSLKWCDDVVVVDSLSRDRTAELCVGSNVRLVTHRFESMWEQRNWALENAGIRNEWALILDADEVVSKELAAELLNAVNAVSSSVAAFRVRRRFFFWGRWLKHSSLYPTWLVRVVRRQRVRFHAQGHGEGQVVDGAIGSLHNALIDENLKGIDEWFVRQNYYSSKDAAHELAIGTAPVEWRSFLSGDPIKKRQTVKRLAMNIPGRAWWYFLYTYILRGGWLDGRDGLMFCLMRAMYQEMVVIKKYDRLRHQVREPSDCQ